MEQPKQQLFHERLTKRRFTWGFALAVALYFMWNATVAKNPEWGILAHIANDLIKCLPVAAAGIATWCITGSVRWMPAALLFSALGDLAGEHREFILQIAMFAIAHIVYCIHFLRRTTFDKRAAILLALLLLMVIVLGTFIIGRINNDIEQICCSIYIVIIAAMAGSAILHTSPYKWWNALAALLFIFSDSCIAINRFVEHIPHAGVIIMSTYFAAQYIFARVYINEYYKSATCHRQ